ncbi:hypothetical protein L3X38_000115 [Prunus dulcis]|uniref:Uncharacterized protein n=1 Tax=Prunus dulcis TaxID=3755 RepID=A0AAD4UST3_PRUDU|nr:hypothetical protein L3X38_000115 [Prunus dulcis]
MEAEVMLGIPAEKAWEIYRDNDIINKINPEMLTSAEYIEGDGCHGSLRLFKLGPIQTSAPSTDKFQLEIDTNVKIGRALTILVMGRLAGWAELRFLQSGQGWKLLD